MLVRFTHVVCICVFTVCLGRIHACGVYLCVHTCVLVGFLSSMFMLGGAQRGGG